MSPPLPTMVTDRLALRAWGPDDAGTVLAIYSRPEVVRWSGGPGTELATRADAIERLARWETRMAGGAPRGIWAITDASDVGTPAAPVVGAVLLVDLPASSPDRSRPPSGDLEIGWHLHPDRWGSGYATEAARAVLAHAWAHGVRRVLAVTHPDNAASQAVARRIGMRHEGRTTAYYDTEAELFAIEAPA
ncbi:GNAT family N-acetyltransferase [Georgenia sp. Z1344]|uniref:GNAT family N-acetyltransferase n=1 Tax=Georgenia sp. Z1344 TaxID=3416706 RepID=UPI003CF74901